MSSFYGLNIAKTGLFLSQRALNVTGHNISNVNTDGYTRQRIVAQAVDPANAMTFLMPSGTGKVGAGVQVQVLDQIRDSFIDKELRREYAMNSMLEVKADAYIYMEKIFDETVSSSLSVALKLFANSFQEFELNVDNSSFRVNVRSNLNLLTDTLNHYYTQLEELQKVQNDSMKATVDRINDYTQAIAEFNKQIHQYELSGDQANDLRDKRNQLVDNLSKLVDIEYVYDDLDRLTITLGGAAIVNHQNHARLKVVGDQTGVETGQPDFYRVCLDDGLNTEIHYSAGELQAYRDMRDGNSPTHMGIPYMIGQLNTLARSIAREFNDINSNGWTYPHDGLPSMAGKRLFHVDGNPPDYSTVSAKNIAISQDFLNDVYVLAASSARIDANNPYDTGNNENALRILELLASENVADVGNFEAFLSDLVVELGAASGGAQNLYTSQAAVVSNLEYRKESISGVSIDEEVVNMISYQHMYAASSRMITAIDEALDILINRTGLVGR
ncbi:MAG: flagellar hook-associated protein FlgK [Christensenellales bacterium]|jgi:flagellar hook-associated protein 1 FlgK